MKNIFGTQESINLYDENKVLMYKYANVDGYRFQLTRDSDRGILTYKDSQGLCFESEVI